MSETAAQAFGEYLTVGEASEFLGVSPWTLRNWDNSGKLKSHRHPLSGYRMYRRKELAGLLGSVVSPDKRSYSLTPQVDWDQIGDTEHFVQFYERDSYLVESLSAYLGRAINAGEGALAIASPSHINRFEKKLRRRGLDLSLARDRGQYVTLNAAETLSKLLVDGSVDSVQFEQVIGTAIERMNQRWQRVRAFGEMVALLWKAGNRQGALQLEKLWNDLAKRYSFSLFCAYPMDGFQDEVHGTSLRDICDFHGRVIPAESYSRLSTPGEQLRTIALLQQKARHLEAEVAKRREAEGDQAMLAAIIESSDDAIISKALDGTIRSWNAAAQLLFGYSESEAIGQPITLIIPPERHDEERQILQRLKHGERIEHYETARMAKDGRRIDVSLTISPLRNSLGNLIGASSIARDITDRKRVEKALRESQERLSHALESIQKLQEAGSSLIEEGDSSALNYKILDTAVEIMQSDWASMQVVDEERNALRLLAWRGFGPEFGEVFQLCSPDAGTVCAVARQRGQRVIVSDVETCKFIAGTSALDDLRRMGIRAIQSTPLISRTGKTLGMISTYWRVPHQPAEKELHLLDLLARQAADLIDRLQAEQRLRESEQRFRQLVELLPVGMYTCDLSGAITYYNGQAARLWGREPKPGDEKDRYCGSFKLFRTDGTYLPHDQCPMAVALHEEREFRNQEVDIERPDGSRITALVNIDPIRVAKGQVVGAINVFHDISALKHAEQQLKEADRRKDEFLATLAHELRNPLAPIRNGLHLLRMADPDDASTQQIHAMMERQVAHLVRLVDDLLELSRISRGKIELKKQRIDLSAAINHALETSRPFIEAGAHKLEVLRPQEPLLVEGDLVRLSQVLSNLLNNAAKYTQKRGTITLSAERNAHQIAVSIRDTGIGIPQHMLSRVFDMFTQVENPLRRSQDGLGIGLSLVRTLVMMHGGSVEAYSNGVGLGSEFVVRLPAVDSMPQATNEDTRSIKPATVGGSPVWRILAVDDNQDSVDSLSMMLRLLGADVQTAYDGKTALKRLKIWRPSIILMDLGMPEMDGCEVARCIRRDPENRDVILIALTGWGQEEDRRRSREAGFNYHLVKPVDLGALEALLASCKK